MPDEQDFKRDNETDPSRKNSKLAAHLESDWNLHRVIKIERKEDDDSGWLLTYTT